MNSAILFTPIPNCTIPSYSTNPLVTLDVSWLFCVSHHTKVKLSLSLVVRSHKICMSVVTICGLVYPHDSRPVHSNPGPEELHGSAGFQCCSTPTHQLEQLITQLHHLTWLPGSQQGADFKVKTKSSGRTPVARRHQGWRAPVCIILIGPRNPERGLERF